MQKGDVKMSISDNRFPVDVSVLSGSAINERIKSEYFSKSITTCCRLYYRGIHDTYIVIVGEKTFYYKVYRYGYRTPDEIKAEVFLLNHLKNSGIPATEPVMKNDRSYILQFDTVEGTRYGVLYSSAGVKSSNEIEETDLYNEKLGSYISSIHNAWDKIECTVDRWHLDSKSFIDTSMNYIREFSQWYPFDIDFLEQVANKTKEKIDDTLMKNMPEYGICHGDIYSGNYRFDSYNNPILFDFDFCGYGWRAYDISLYTNAFSLGFDVSAMEKRANRREAFLKGYHKNRALSETEINSIYLFIPFRRIFNIGTLYIHFANTWGDNWVISNINEDIKTLKKWIDVYKVL